MLGDIEARVSVQLLYRLLTWQRDNRQYEPPATSRCL